MVANNLPAGGQKDQKGQKKVNKGAKTSNSTFSQHCQVA